MADRGNLFVIAAPSGTGKTSLVNAIVDAMPSLNVSISHTTRPMRPGETEGLNYYFVDKAEFESMIAHQDFLEHATIFGNLYGTSKSHVEKTLVAGIDVILEIDWQGHQQIKRLFPEAISIFILPPSHLALEERLMKRNQDSQEVIQKRLADAREAVSHVHEFDYVVINDTFAHAQADLLTIVNASRLRLSCQTKKYAGLIQELVNPQ